MAGTIAASVIKNDTTSPPQFQNSAGTEVGQLCRAWVNFNGVTTATIRSSFNVSSVTRTATGQYTINFTSAMPDANYSFSGMVGSPAANTGAYLFINQGSAPTASSISVRLITDGGTSQDATYIGASFFR